MTYKVLIDLILLRVNGGSLNDDASVTRPDVEEYLPVALNLVVNQEVERAMQRARVDKQTTGFGSDVMDPAFFRTYTLDVVMDESRARYYAALPGIINSMPAGLGFDYATPAQNPAAMYTKVNPQDIPALGDLVDVVPFVWHEVYDGESRIYLTTKPNPLCQLLVRASITKSAYSPDDELDLPSGLEKNVIDICVQHFMGQRQMPDDVKEDNVDVNAQPNASGQVQNSR